MKTDKTDVLVIGAGPSGTVAASIIKKAGFTVMIVEKMKFPRFVIGESLLPRCMEALVEAGFLDAVKACGFQEKYGAKFVKNGKICDYFLPISLHQAGVGHGRYQGQHLIKHLPIPAKKWASRFVTKQP